MSPSLTTYVLVSLAALAVVQRVRPQDPRDNEVEDAGGNLADVAAELLGGSGMQHVGSVLSGLLQAGAGAGGKDLGGALAGALADGSAADLLQNLGSALGANAQGALDPSILGSLLSMMESQPQKHQARTAGGGGDFDIPGLLSMFGGFLAQTGGPGGGAGGLMAALPLLLQTASDFAGPGAAAREAAHRDHQDAMPPLLERLHVLLDHFVNSELGRKAADAVGAEKFVRVFADEGGNFSYELFVERMENHSFRRHWITMVTDRLTTFVAFLADPVVRQKYLTTGQYVLNNYLEQKGFPKKALVDIKRPVESISSLIDYSAINYFSIPFDAKHYVKPAVSYVKDVFRLVESKGYLSTGKSRELSNKLADTINLEIIEPVSRVNRAYKFASKVTSCDLYVMCLINQEEDDRGQTLPGLKKLLYKLTSYAASWFLSGTTGTPFLTLYQVISEPSKCKALYREECNGFHNDELKVTTEYVHNEL